MISIFRLTFVLFASNFGLEAPNIAATGDSDDAFANPHARPIGSGTRERWLVRGDGRSSGSLRDTMSE